MIEERAVVTDVRRGKVRIKATGGTTCDACTGCSTATLSGFFTKHNEDLWVNSMMPLELGETVIVGVEEHQLLGWASVIYLLPLIGFFSGAILGRFLAESIAFFGENLIVFMGGGAGFTLFVQYIKNNSFLKSHQLRPVLVRKAHGVGMG